MVAPRFLSAIFVICALHLKAKRTTSDNEVSIYLPHFRLVFFSSTTCDKLHLDRDTRNRFVVNCIRRDLKQVTRRGFAFQYCEKDFDNSVSQIREKLDLRNENLFIDSSLNSRSFFRLYETEQKADDAMFEYLVIFRYPILENFSVSMTDRMFLFFILSPDANYCQ